jgi:hypothetical protein
MTQLIELTYVSEPTQEMSFLGLMRLLDHSYSRNTSMGFTGALIFENNHFGQVIEGPKAQIEDLWTKIQKDTRHRNIRLIDSKKISHRGFSNWSMVFQDSEAVAKHLPDVAVAVEDVNFPAEHPLLIALRDLK